MRIMMYILCVWIYVCELGFIVPKFLHLHKPHQRNMDINKRIMPTCSRVLALQNIKWIIIIINTIIIAKFQIFSRCMGKE